MRRLSCYHIQYPCSTISRVISPRFSQYSLATTMRIFTAQNLFNDAYNKRMISQFSHPPKPFKLPRWHASKVDHMESTPISKASSLETSSMGSESHRKTIIENIARGKRHNDANQILSCIALARQLNIALDPDSYLAGLWAASVINDDKAKEAFLILNAFPKDFNIPQEAYSLILGVCARYGNSHIALDLIAKYQNRGYPYEEIVLRNLILSLIVKGDKYLLGKIRYYFREYNQGVQRRKWKPDRDLFEQLAVAMSYCEGQGQETVDIIRNMTDCGFEPTFNLCRSLITGALTSKETTILKVMLSWCLEHFSDHQLDDGTINELCQVAVCQLDDDLSRLIIRLVECSMNKHQSDENTEVPAWYYYIWILSSIRKDNIIGILEALVETMNRKYDLYQIGLIDGNEAIPSYGDVVRDALADCLTSRIVFQDNFYAALVDLTRSDYQVPKIALDALIISTAKSGKQDRSFATFEEYRTLFGVTPDIHSYNGLLLSASFRVSKLEFMFRILQEMEKHEITLNRLSFSIIFDKMIDLNDFQDYQAILGHMRLLNILPYPKILRKLAIEFASRHDWESLRETLWMLLKAQGNFQGRNRQPTDLESNKDRINYLLPKYLIPDFLLNRMYQVSGDRELTVRYLQYGLNQANHQIASSNGETDRKHEILT